MRTKKIQGKIYDMTVIYAEKPDVAKKIAAALDKITLSSGSCNFEELAQKDNNIKSQQHRDGWLKIRYKDDETYVTWGYGHLCGLKQAQDYDPEYRNWSHMPIPFFPDDFGVKVSEGKTKQFNIVKKLLDTADNIINATDDDREGELIFYYLIKAAGCKKDFKRVHFSSQTKNGIQEAFSSLINASDIAGRTSAGRGRSLADWIVGANTTAALSISNPGSGVLSVGRVQTPTLNMIVKRELEIRNFKPEPYYTLDAVFTTSSGDEFKGEYKSGRFNSRKDAEDVLKNLKENKGTIKSVTSKEIKKQPPSLYNQSALQMEANSRYGFTLDHTLEIAQKLYEDGLTTYPRTDSRYLTNDMEPVVNKVLDSLALFSPVYKSYIDGHTRKYTKNKYFDSSKVSSHYAIIPTGNYPDRKKITKDEAKLFDLIAKSVIAMIYGPASIKKTNVEIDVNGEIFKANGSVITKAGFMDVLGKGEDQILPALCEGDIVSVALTVSDKMTKAPKRYTDKTLVSAMITCGKELEDEDLEAAVASGVKGIGTEATRAGIVKTLETRKYIVREKKSLVATERGISVIQALPIEEMKSAALTAQWEERLNKIENKTDDLKCFVSDIEKKTSEWCSDILKSSGNFSINKDGETEKDILRCPACNRPLHKMDWGWGCTGYRNGCKFSIGKICDKKISDAQIKKLIRNGSTDMIKGFKSKKGTEFDARLVLNKEAAKNGQMISFDFSDASSNKPKNNSGEANKDGK